MDEKLLKEALKDMLKVISEVHEEVVELRRRVEELEKK
jgi:hypothetical protein